jgi:chromate transport protein ChrA
VTPATPVTPSRVHRLFEVMRYFLWLGVTGFGGPVALCGLMERDLVEQREWLDKSQMRDVIAVCQTMPGPLAVQVATFVGYMRCGILGAWASGWALILPAAVAKTVSCASLARWGLIMRAHIQATASSSTKRCRACRPLQPIGRWRR